MATGSPLVHRSPFHTFIKILRVPLAVLSSSVLGILCHNNAGDGKHAIKLYRQNCFGLVHIYQHNNTLKGKIFIPPPHHKPSIELLPTFMPSQVKIKCKTQLQAWIGPEGSRRLGLSDFMTVVTCRW